MPLGAESGVVEEILFHLAEIGAGKCSISDDTIAAEPDSDMRQILVGLLILHEDLAFERERREQGEGELARLLDERQRAIDARDEFFAAASHELRTPLATLSLQAELFADLLQRINHVRATAALDRLKSVKRQLDRINTLVDEMLDVSRITLGQLALRPGDVDLVALTKEVIAHFELESSRQNVDVSLQAPQPVVGRWDSHRIEQVITNLLANALKYGEHRPVQIRVGTLGERALLEVLDQGIGISEQDQVRIFTPFGRAASVEHFGGIGLGLWISQQIVTASGGTIRVSSRPREGSKFSVELPRQPP